MRPIREQGTERSVRVNLSLLGSFALAAFVLAMLGIYGVMT